MQLEVLKKYNTKKGPAVTVGVTHDNYFRVWHESLMDTRLHDADGKACTIVNIRDYDIISEWHEPRTSEFWVNVYLYDGKKVWFGYKYSSKSEADQQAAKSNLSEFRLDCIHIKWTEGKGAEIIK